MAKRRQPKWDRNRWQDYKRIHLFMEDYCYKYTCIMFIIYLSLLLLFKNYLFYSTTLYSFCHTLTSIHHGCICVPHPELPSHLPPYPIPQGHPTATSPEHPVSCIELGLAVYFTYDNIQVSMLFSQIIPPSPSPTESKSLFFTSVSLLCTALLNKSKSKGPVPPEWLIPSGPSGFYP